MPTTLRQATCEDAEAIAALVAEAYSPYIPRIGHKPGPMLEDYLQVLRDEQVLVAQQGERLVGVLVLRREQRELLLVNVAVLPACKGQGIGGLLLDACEAQARALGCEAVRLYTHERMTENLALYQKRGYCETHRATQDGFARVFMRKPMRDA
jgi:ribosomal protein S18 acetylase RimI-like enzyme